jgi:alpha-galactosidase
MERAAPELTLAGGALRLQAAHCRTAGGGAADEHIGTGWRSAGEDLACEAGPVTVRVRRRRAGAVEELTLVATSSDEVEVAAVGLSFEAQVAGVPPAWAVYDGYHSWDAAGVAPLAEGGRPRRSFWRCGLADGAGTGIALAAGASQRHVTRFDATAGEVRWLQVAPAAGTAEAPVWCSATESEFHSEPLRVTAGGDVRAALATALPDLARNPAPPPHGWLSWYHLGVWVDASAVLANAELIPRSAGSVVQIDDGWQQTYGDWQPNTKFRDLAGLCSDLRGRGCIPGIWTAPFLASAGSDLASTAPDGWFLRDAAGARLVDPRHTVFGPMHVLDPREAEVRRHLTGVFGDLRRTGFSHFKIDFLYAGAYGGVDAFRRGLDAIRLGAGDDSYLLACGAPLLPVAGLVDGCRIGPDTCTPWPDFSTGEPQPTFFGDEVQNVIRNVAGRADLGPWFHTDPDVAVAGGTLSPAKARQLVTAVALCGGLYFLSDDLRVLADDRKRIALNRELAEIAEGGPATPDWEPTPTDLPPAVWRRGEELVAVFNHGTGALRRSVPVPAAGAARDVWTGESLQPADGALELEVEPEGVRLIRFGDR